MITLKQIIQELEKDSITIKTNTETACTTDGEVLIYLKEFQSLSEPASVYEKRKDEPFCPRCESSAYLYAENGKENKFCGNCGQCLNWESLENMNSFLVIGKISEEFYEKIKNENIKNKKLTEMECFFSFKYNMSPKLVKLEKASKFSYTEKEKIKKITAAFQKYRNKDFHLFQVKNEKLVLVPLEEENYDESN